VHISVAGVIREYDPASCRCGSRRLVWTRLTGAWHSDLSFAAYQYQLHGFVSNSMIVVNILHAFYVVDFFINEDWSVALLHVPASRLGGD